MNWDAVGAIGEIVGALAVVLTLIVLIFQVRYSTRAMEESNKLERMAAIDRHADTISMWRARTTENHELAEIWLKVLNNEVLNEVELLRANNMFIELTNTQRSNYLRAKAVGELGLALQAVRAVATQASISEIGIELWKGVAPWAELASKRFVELVDAEIEKIKMEGVGNMSLLPKVLWQKAKELGSE